MKGRKGRRKEKTVLRERTKMYIGLKIRNEKKKKKLKKYER